MKRRAFLKTLAFGGVAGSYLVGAPSLVVAKSTALSAAEGTRRGTIATARHTTSYLEAGRSDGPVIVLVHGWPGIAETWRHQLHQLSALGFRVIAPDLRGCGHSSTYRTHGAYAQREIVRDMIELIDGLGIERAAWIGHDWGAIVVSNIARHHSKRCVGVGGISQPFNTLERGIAALIPLLNRDVYPAERFPAGQFDYMKFYHEQFDVAQASFEANVTTMFKAVMRRGDPAGAFKPYLTAFVRQRGGWFGPNGQPAPDLALDTAVFDQVDLDAYVKAYSRTGFFGVNALYKNDADNGDYFDSAPSSLELPVLLLTGTYDYVCDTEHSDLAAPMRAACADLTYMIFPAGHWLPHEQPSAVSAAIYGWLAVGTPSYLSAGGGMR